MTLIDIFSIFPFILEVADKSAATVGAAYNNWVSVFAEPECLLSDNGPEFNSIETPRHKTAANHPQGNSVLERFHKELGAQSRIHNCSPVEAVQYLRTHQQRLLFYSGLKIKYSDSSLAVFDFQLREFEINDLVWRHIPRRSQSKPDDVFSGPHRVIKRVGDVSYMITSKNSSSISNLDKVNINDLKTFVIPDSSNWTLN